MSFILDALKKSENERQRQVGPSLADVQVRRRRGDKPWWVVAVGALLVVNLGVLLVVLTRNGDSGTPQQQAAATTQPEAARTSDTQRPLPASESRMPRGNPPTVAAQDPAVRSLADEAGQEVNMYGASAEPTILGPPGAASIPEGPPLVRPIEAPAVAPAGAQPVFESRTTEPQEVLPTAMDLAASGTNLPEMHLDIHVYSRNPADRFVFVNMRKYTEGQSLSEGPALERITTQGVILNHRGLRFLLPRQ
ncbi:MAG: general secretion pathway protein GspB [Steroidobacteraceae bacterium]